MKIKLGELKTVSHKAVPKDTRFYLLGVVDRVDKAGECEVVLADDLGGMAFRKSRTDKSGKSYAACWALPYGTGQYAPCGYTPSGKHVFIRSASVLCVVDRDQQTDAEPTEPASTHGFE